MICIQLKIKCKIILLKTLENGLNKSYFMTYHLPIGKFNLPISLGMIGGGQPVYHSILFHKDLERSIAKVLPIVTNDCVRHPKTRENLFSQEFQHNLMNIYLICNGLNPFRDIIYCQEDI